MSIINRKSIVVILLLSFTTFASAQLKIGYILSERIRSEYEEFKEAESQLQLEYRKVQFEFDQRVKRLDSLKQDYEVKRLMSLDKGESIKQQMIQMERAIQVEMNRQEAILRSGGTIVQQTRNYDDNTQTTTALRDKEDAHDYRYFPDPDLLPLKIEQKLIDDLKKTLPELPDNKKERFINDYGLNSYEANVLISEKDISDYYEEVAKLSDKKLAATWMMGDLFAMLNDKGLNISNSPISAKNFAELVRSIKSGEISGRIAKEVFEIMVKNGENPKKIIESKGMKQQSDPKELEKIINALPQLQCKKCTYDDCESYAQAILHSNESINKCEPGANQTRNILKKLIDGDTDLSLIHI